MIQYIIEEKKTLIFISFLFVKLAIVTLLISPSDLFNNFFNYFHILINFEFAVMIKEEMQIALRYNRKKHVKD